MNQFNKTTRLYLICMSLFWLVFGLITTFYPKLMDMFQSQEGINSKTDFSNHVWSHDGLDIMAMSILLLVLSRERVSRSVLRAVGIAALLPTLGIFYSLFSTPYWSNLFIVPGLGCFAFVIWGFVLAGKRESTEKMVSAR